MVFGEAAAQAGIALDKSPHIVGVPCGDDDDAIPVVLHEFQQRVDGFLAEIVTPAGTAVGRQRIGFIDEQDAIERLATFVERFCRVGSSGT